MHSWKNAAFCSVVLSTALALGGCSSTAKPDVPSAAPSPAPAEQPKAESKKQPAAGVSESSAKSSLDALKSGESTATSGNGPLKEVYFDFDSYDLRADARETLKANAGWLKTNPAAQVQIEGHADEQGTNEYNLALGAKRAQSVMDYLVTLGTAANRLSTISYGEEVPLCKEKTEDCWQKNRRARFVVQPARPTS